jgi:transposase
MRFYTTPPPFSCGIDLHARPLYVCILDQGGEGLVHRHMQSDPEAFLKAIAPYRQGLGVAVECLCTWYWLAALWADQGSSFVLGHALSMQALHGGQAKNDTIDSQKMAQLWRGGMLPHASVSPAKLRATRDVLRRRMPLTPTRAALLAHGQQTKSQSPLPALGKKIADKANRDGVAERCADPAVPQSLAVDLALIPSDDEPLGTVERSILTTARHHDANTRSLLHPVPGIGTMLRLGRRSAIHDIPRFPRGQEFLSSCRRGTCRKESAGKRLGTSGAKIGTAPLQWAFADAAVLFLSNHPAAQNSRARLEKKHDKGQAVTLLAQKLARAVYSMRTRQGAVATETFSQREGRGADEPDASLDNQGNAP